MLVVSCFGLDGSLYDFGPEVLESIQENPRDFSLIEKDLLKHWERMDSSFDDLSWAILNYKLCEEILNAYNVTWAYSYNGEADAAEPAERLKADGWFDPKRSLNIVFDQHDHLEGYPKLPGFKSHKVFAEEVGKWVIKNIKA